MFNVDQNHNMDQTYTLCFTEINKMLEQIKRNQDIIVQRTHNILISDMQQKNDNELIT